MSVASKNPFALLDEDGLNPPAPEPAPAPTTATATNQSSNKGGQRGGRGGRGGPGTRGGKYYARGGPRTSAPREGADDEGADDSAGKKAEFTEGGRGRGRGGRGRGRGDRDGPRGDREGHRGGGRQRTYDRHSGTGKTDSEKKIHQSWGGDEGQTELATETAAANDAAAEQTAPAENWEPSGGGDDWAAGGGAGADWSGGGGNNDWTGGGGDTNWGVEGGNSDGATSAPAPAANADEPADPERSDRRPRDRQDEEQDNTLTFDQYLAQQKEKNPLVPQLETRKIEQDESLWKGAKELVKAADEDVYFVGKTKNVHKTRAKKEDKVYLEIEARFERPSRGRGRGERGGERGGRPRDRDRGRGQRSNGYEGRGLNVDDETAFPSLS